MEITRPLFIAFILAAMPGVSSPAEPLVPVTNPPEIVRLEFSGEIFEKVDSEIAGSVPRPTGVIAGFATPVTCQWGPVDVFWGENPWELEAEKHLTRAAYRLLAPESVARRIERIKGLTKTLNKQKVTDVAPTFAFSTIVGDYRKRLGFWEFYDRWERYTKWAGSRPWNDPFDWLCVDRDGKPILVPDNPGTSPHEVRFDRYRCCIHHPDWTRFQQTVLLSSGEVGYSGALADDVLPVECFCRYCRRQFRTFLNDPNRPAWVDRLSEGKNPSDLTLESADTPPELIRRWRLLSTASHLETLRAAAKTSTTAGFAITADGLRLADAIPIGEAADRLLFTNVAAPGIRTTGTLPENNNVTVGVVEKAAKTEYLNYVFRIRHPGTDAILRAKIRLPALSGTAKTLPVSVAISLPPIEENKKRTVGDFHLSFTDVKTGKKTKVPLNPAKPDEDGKPAEDGKPVTAKWAGNWSPKTPGTYEVSFGFTHRAGTGPTVEEVPYQARLRWPRICRSHQAELLFAQQMKAKPLFVGTDWFALRSPATVRTLALAEMAAFGGGGGYVVAGDAKADGPLNEMSEFMRANSNLFAGWSLDGSVGVLYSAWGPNPVSVRPNEPFSQLTQRLATEHRPYVALIDRELPADAGSLARLKAVYLVSPRYDLSDAQIKALKVYLTGGGRIVISSDRTALNSELIRTILGPNVEAWDSTKPALPGRPVVSSGAGTENVRVACYQKGNRLAVHLVNYNVCLLDPQGKAISLRDLTVNIELPPGWKGASVTALAPGAAPVSLPAKVEQGLCVVRLPELQIYSILLLEPAPAGAASASRIPSTDIPLDVKSDNG